MTQKKYLIALVLFIGLFSSQGNSNGLFPTKLKVYVIDILGNFVEGAEVTLYGNKEDYLANKNPKFKGLTNDKGWVTFKKIDIIPYFIEVVKGDLRNYGKGVQVEDIEEGKKNKINLIVE
jgi:hypothetical protein